MSGDVNISTCWCCNGRIYFRGRSWRHKADGLPFSTIGGDHTASPFKPDETVEVGEADVLGDLLDTGKLDDVPFDDPDD